MTSPLAPGFLAALLLIGACALSTHLDERRDPTPPAPVAEVGR